MKHTHPAERYTTFLLDNNKFISVHSTLKDLEDLEEQEVWFDEDHSRELILNTLNNYESN